MCIRDRPSPAGCPSSARIPRATCSAIMPVLPRTATDTKSPCWICVIPVSYTHLDVYKRQQQDFPYAAYELGKMYRDGIGCEKDAEASEQWYRQMCIRDRLCPVG